MKKITPILLVLAVLMLFVSCGQDDLSVLDTETGANTDTDIEDIDVCMADFYMDADEDEVTDPQLRGVMSKSLKWDVDLLLKSNF